MNETILLEATLLPVCFSPISKGQKPIWVGGDFSIVPAWRLNNNWVLFHLYLRWKHSILAGGQAVVRGSLAPLSPSAPGAHAESQTHAAWMGSEQFTNCAWRASSF